MASASSSRSLDGGDDIDDLCLGLRPGLCSADVVGGAGTKGAALKDDIAERMGVVLQECLPSQCGAPEAWHYAQALAALGSRVLQEMHRAGSVGAMVTGLIAQAAMDLELAEWKDGRFYVRSRVHGDKPPVPEEELGEIEQAERKGAFARAAEEERGDRPPDPVDFSPAVSDAGIGP